MVERETANNLTAARIAGAAPVTTHNLLVTPQQRARQFYALITNAAVCVD